MCLSVCSDQDEAPLTATAITAHIVTQLQIISGANVFFGFFSAAVVPREVNV